MNNQEKQVFVHQEFINSMVEELNNNSHKGEWIDWKNDVEISKEIEYHFEKLSVSKKNNDKAKIKEHIADVANLLMMLGNSYGIYINESNKL